MARKAQAKSKTNAKRTTGAKRERAAGPAEDRARVVGAVFSIARDGGWPGCGLDDIAERAGLTRTRLLRHLPAKTEVLHLVADHVDDAVLADADRDPVATEGDAKDRLFDALMRRFDVLQDDRDGVSAVLRWAMRDPAAASCAATRAARSMRLTLELAGISTRGPFGLVRIKGLMLVYARTLRAWMADDSEDMARTMSALDKALTLGERVLDRLAPPWRRGRSKPSDVADANGGSVRDAD